jgi:hypothetical protein
MIQKRRGKMVVLEKAIFPSSLGAVLEVLKESISKAKIRFPKLP